MCANFLPAINTGQNNMGAAATGMSGVRTGQSFVKTTKAGGLGLVASARPKRSGSIVDLMSARDMVREFTKRGSNDDFGIDGYVIPKVEGTPRKKQPGGFIPKNKMPGPIESECRFRRNYPGTGSYTLPYDKTWTEQAGKKIAHTDFTKAPRRMMAQEIAENSQKPEKSSPSPQHYGSNKDYLLPKVGRGGYSLLQA